MPRPAMFLFAALALVVCTSRGETQQNKKRKNQDQPAQVRRRAAAVIARSAYFTWQTAVP